MADQLNMGVLSLEPGQGRSLEHGEGRLAYIPPHMRGQPPPIVSGQTNGNAK